jgi:hypothetical protein
VPLNRLTTSHVCLTASALWRAGLMVEGASGTLQTAHGGCQIATREGRIFINGFPVRIADHPHLRWKIFLCPSCSEIRHKLFRVDGRWGCYRCHRLTHASRHHDRMLPNLHRVKRLRRKIGAPEMFSPIARCGRRQHKSIAIEIRKLEMALLDHLRVNVCSVLKKRHERRSSRS